MIAISEAVHAVGGFRLLRSRQLQRYRRQGAPGRPGIDAMHINLHKTFSTPHGRAAVRDRVRWSCPRRSPLRTFALW
jgi:glycine cleavage system protein P-like pyridoxal-binding family